jgi:hypothetical protein
MHSFLSPLLVERERDFDVYVHESARVSFVRVLLSRVFMVEIVINVYVAYTYFSSFIFIYNIDRIGWRIFSEG